VARGKNSARGYLQNRTLYKTKPEECGTKSYIYCLLELAHE